VVDVTEADVDEAIKRIADPEPPYAAKSEGAKADNSDRVTINFKGTIDGVAFDGGTGRGHSGRDRRGQFIPGFEELAIGMGVGETRTLKVSFPKNYASEKLAARPAEFETRRLRSKPPARLRSTTSLPKRLAESLDKLKEAARERLTTPNSPARSASGVKRTLLDRLDESHQFEAPPSLVAKSSS